MDLWAYAAISSKLKPATYHVVTDEPTPAQPDNSTPVNPDDSSAPVAAGSPAGAVAAASSPGDMASQVVLGFLLGHYGFKRYKSPDPKDLTPGKAKLVWPAGCDR